MNPFARLQRWEKELRRSYNTDLSTPENRRKAEIYNLWFDHAVLRCVWTNFFEIAPGVWRSNHPTRKRFEKMKAMGIRTVLNLRGSGTQAHYLTEAETCEQLGLTLVSSRLYARKAASREEILGLIDVLKRIEPPFVMHCKSGADRAGFASAVYLMVVKGVPVEQARRMLSVKYVHFRWTKTGVLDHILDLYATRNAEAPIGFEEWIATEYDQEAAQVSFDAAPKKLF
ncbi:tyrosine-protein phosphatase [Pseudooceanicola nanhaiensis]|uniref:tyrosine-protein phosphatase n=1 Tax=Pseudooceanicola nanhaiensis TaxID=375761 RepID=UPI001CD6C98E|nr:tyrosine-protein phosphatase [Pseudooceanicola nanhaiensis]MCA0922001.1 tyrosine-protein phosphatase [Pseudooceanicola nanhaiensis]